MFVQIRDSRGCYHGAGLTKCSIQSIIDRYTEELKRQNADIRVMLIGDTTSREAMNLLKE